MASVLGKSLFGVAAALLACGASVAQSVTFKEAVKAFRLGNAEEAKAKFEAVLAEQPTNEQAFELWTNTDPSVWMALLEDDSTQRYARYLLDLAKVGRAERSRDMDAAAALVERAITGDFDQRSRAALDLASSHGEFAVPALVEKLGDTDSNDAQVHAIVVLQRIGRLATLPLIAALASDNETARRNTVAALAGIRDERAVPALVSLAKSDPSTAVREAAAKAAESMGISAAANPVNLYLAQARRYLGTGVRSSDQSDVVWSFRDGALVHADAPRPVYRFELAKRDAHAALRLDSTNGAAKATLARAYLAQAAAITDAAAAGDESVQDLVARVPALRMLAAATGTDVVRAAVTDAIADGMVPAAVAGIELLGDLEASGNLAGSPLVAALDSVDSRIAYAAALALAKASGGAVPAADRVVRNLANAVTEESLSVVKIIDRSDAGPRAIEASWQGVSASVSDSAYDAIGDLFRFPNVDVIVISENIEVLPEALIGNIRKDARLAKAKILVVAADPAAAEEKYGDDIDGTIAGPITGEALKAAVARALRDVDASAMRARGDDVAISASQALAKLAGDRIDLGGALASLTAQLDRMDAVAIPAAAAIGRAGSMAQVDALIQVLQSDAASAELKVACADAVGNIFARSSAVSQETFEQLLAVVTTAGDDALRGAVARAFGRGSIGADAKLKLIEALQVSATMNSDG